MSENKIAALAAALGIGEDGLEAFLQRKLEAKNAVAQVAEIDAEIAEYEAKIAALKERKKIIQSRKEAISSGANEKFDESVGIRNAPESVQAPAEEPVAPRTETVPPLREPAEPVKAAAEPVQSLDRDEKCSKPAGAFSYDPVQGSSEAGKRFSGMSPAEKVALAIAATPAMRRCHT